MASEVSGGEGTDSKEEAANLNFLAVSVARMCKVKHAGMVYLRNLTTVPVSFCFTQSDQPAFDIMPLSGIVDPFDVHFVSVALLNSSAVPQDQSALERLEVNLKAAQVPLDSLLAREVASSKGRECIITKACEKVQVSRILPCMQKKRRRKARNDLQPSSPPEIMDTSLSVRLKQAYRSPSPGGDGSERPTSDAEFMKHQDEMLAELENVVNANFSFPAKTHRKHGPSRPHGNDGQCKAAEDGRQELVAKPVDEDG
uniref:Uncharacterized protein n=1 Tax=Trichuris muris TaxID=70415 RepID=A0A5S6QQ03_TRIMR